MILNDQALRLCLNKKTSLLVMLPLVDVSERISLFAYQAHQKLEQKPHIGVKIATPKISLHFISHLLKIPLCIFSFGARWHRMVISPPTQPQPQKLCFFVASFNRKIVAIQYFCIKLTATQILLQKFNCLLLILFYQ